MDPHATAPAPGTGWRGRLAYLGRRRPGLYLFVAVACLNLASMSREVAWGDARPVYEVAESMIHGRGVAVHTRWPSDAAPGPDGKYYAAQPWLPSLVHLPGLALCAPLFNLHVGPEVARVRDSLACHFAGSLLGALVVWLFFRMCLQHGASRRRSAWLALVLALGSTLWVYARYPFTEIVQTACFTGFFFALVGLTRRLHRRTAFAVGLWAGLLLNTKYIYALSLPGALLVVVGAHWRDRRALVRAMGASALGLLPGVAMVLLYNYLRFGSVLRTGYANLSGVMVENPLASAWGFLFSPGKSIFLYTPPLLLALLGLRRFWYGHRLTVLAMLATILPVVAFYARFPSWTGDWAWGPRYLVFATPVLLLPAISFLSAVRWPGRTLAAAVVALGIFVQVLGNAFYWDHFLRIVLDTRTKWLGAVNRTGALTVDKGGYCEGCFEDVYPMAWLPPFQPILGHFWLLRHVPFHDGWERAKRDAPWRRHTKLDFDGRATYERVRVDHWLYDVERHRAAGWLLLVTLLGGGAAATAVFLRRTRDDDS